MLLNAIQINKAQYDIIKDLDEDGICIFNEAYFVPFWQKECQNKLLPVTDRMKQLAYRLNIPLYRRE